MKTLVVIALFATVSVTHLAYAKEPENPDPSESGSYSHMFSYVLAFGAGTEETPAHFTATLTNITAGALQVQVNDREFHSSLEFTNEDGKKIEFFVDRYRTLLLTSTWFEPVVTIPSKKSIIWQVPLTSLLTLHGDPVTHELIAGKQVLSEMVMMVVPESGSSVSNNAVQQSKTIKIPKKEG